jgi:zinc/manganese transport system permease protein
LEGVIEIILPAIIAGLIVSATHVPLGIEVLKRGIIFIDLAIAQIAGLGIIIARLYFHSEHEHNSLISPEQTTALVFAISAALFFMFIERKAKDIQEAIIGCSFIVASSLALLLLADHPHGGEEIESILAGQILWASWNSLIFAGIAYAAVLFVWFYFRDKAKIFYPLFAICITFSVQIVGVYLVFASLIFPALAVYKIKNRKLFWAYLVSVIAYTGGITLSYQLDYPASPVIVMVFVIISLVSTIKPLKTLNLKTKSP